MTSSSSESILLLVPHVKLKKNEGELYLMSERLGWMVGNKDSFNITHKYSDIKTSFLADIKPQITDGCNGGVRYLLTSDVMASIFRTYPSVKQKHLKCVPNKMTEEEFWKKFFSSHYLHRDKNINDTKDLFTDCGKQDEQILRQDLSTAINDPLLDLTTLNDVVEEESSNPSNSKINNIAQQNMIRRFNQHSILVLKASEQAPGTEPLVPEPAPSKRIRLQEAMSYDDLESNETDPTVQLHLSRIERYLNGPPTTVPSQSGVNGNGSSSTHFEIDSSAFKSIVNRWMRGGGERYNPLDVLNSATAVTVLGELSIGGTLMRGPQPNSAIHLTGELQKELKELYVSLSEILKHFWAAFPPTSPELVQKTNRMIDALHKFNQAKLSPYEQKLIQASTSSEAENILKPLRFQLQAAIKKHSQLSERRPLPRAAVSSM
uniref:BSD domain-containing protein n=1 Tax=Daphnia galeata TaxID=27404 RepID=A0A8J2RH18_9CRUS|nr:unnamed protein product [Daphnia galeata]